MIARDAACSVAFAVSLGAGCLRTAAFECDAAQDCVDAGVAGRCEPTGFCSFPDPECPSEQRYGDHAGNGLAGSCVPVDDGTTGGSADDDGGPSDGGPSTSPTGVDTTPLTDGPESSGATSPIDTTADAETTAASASASSDDAGSESTGTNACPSIVDDFEDGAIDATWTVMDPEWVTEAQGLLILELTPEFDVVYPGVRRSGLDVSSGWVRVDVEDAPGSDVERLWLAIAEDPMLSDVVYLMIEGDQLTIQREQGGMFEVFEAWPYDAMIHDWLQIRGGGDTVAFEVSADGATFETLLELAAPFPLTDATVVVAATNFAVMTEPATVSVAGFEACTE
jgi:hypothetical protein